MMQRSAPAFVLLSDCAPERVNYLQIVGGMTKGSPGVVPTGLGVYDWLAYPTLKRGANERSAYGAGILGSQAKEIVV
jgi:hypothetical protein